jgi:hypothetical protein
MTELERFLVDAGKEIDFPAPPDISTRVARTLPDRPGRRIATSKRGWRLALVAAALILLAAGTAVAAIPRLRHSMLDLLHLRGSTVERTVPLPRVGVRPGPGLKLGQRGTLASARQALPFHVLVPSRLGRPDGVFTGGRAAGGSVALSYRARRGLPEAAETGLGLLIIEFRGSVDPDYLGKMVGLGTRVRRLSIDGYPAAWLAGPPHDFFYRGPSGRMRLGTLRLAGNVLLLERSGLLVRLEGAFGRAEAVSVARSLR